MYQIQNRMKFMIGHSYTAIYSKLSRGDVMWRKHDPGVERMKLDPKVMGSNPGCLRLDLMSFTTHTMGTSTGQFIYQESSNRE